MKRTLPSNHKIPFNPATELLGIYPREIKTYVYTKTCTGKVIAILLVIPKTGKKNQMFFYYESKHKLWYIHTTEQYSARNY